jgi:hypothetical protein
MRNSRSRASSSSRRAPQGYDVPSNNEEIVRRAIEKIWNRGDLDVADELFGSEYVNHNGLITDLVLGPEAIKVSAALYRLAFPDLQVSADVFTADDGIVVLRWTAVSSSIGSGPPATGLATNQQVLTGVTRCQLAGGKISESWTEWWDGDLVLLNGSPRRTL